MVKTVLLAGLDRKRVADCGVGTQEVSTGGEALARLAERNVDAVAVGDIPDMSVAEFVQRIAAAHPALPVVLFSERMHIGVRVWEHVPAAELLGEALRRAAEVGSLRREQERGVVQSEAVAPEVVRAFQRGSVHEMERLMIMARLVRLNQNRTRSAESLDISVRTLRNKLREYREGAAQVAELQGSVLTD